MLIVIEGIDGAGCETQAKNLIKMLGEEKKKGFFGQIPRLRKKHRPDDKRIFVSK